MEPSLVCERTLDRPPGGEYELGTPIENVFGFSMSAAAVADDDMEDEGSAGLRFAPLRVEEVVEVVVDGGSTSKGLLNRDEAETNAEAEAGAEGSTEDVVNIDIDDGVEDEEDGGEEADNEDEDERGMLPNIIEIFKLGVG